MNNKPLTNQERANLPLPTDLEKVLELIDNDDSAAIKTIIDYFGIAQIIQTHLQDNCFTEIVEALTEELTKKLDVLTRITNFAKSIA